VVAGLVLEGGQVLSIVQGERIGRSAAVFVGCSATLFDDARRKILLTRRADNGRWCLPGGHFEPGEDVAEACVREMHEETGLEVRVVRLIGVYSSPNTVLDYGERGCFQVVALNFEVEAIGGELGLSDETTEVDYFTAAEIADLDLLEHHRPRIADAFVDGSATYIR
jgi:ADP-ribose pyrophosphatase YjhB (NUDIX family)